MSGHGRTYQLLSPIRITVRMPERENLKVEDLSKSVKQAPHSEQATGHGMHCREILFTPRCSPRAREFRWSDFSVQRKAAELRGVKVAQFSNFGLFSPYKTPITPNAKVRLSQKLSNSELWCLLTTYRKSYMGFSKNPLLDA